MPSWKKVLISGSDAALNSLNITAALTASGITYPSTDGTSGQVLTTNGSGQLTFSTIASGGTGSSVKLIQTTPASTWTFTHNLNEKFPAVTIYDENDEVIIPLRIEAQDVNTLIIYFSTLRVGTAAAVVGGSTVSASFAQTASHALYALTASYLEGYVSPFPFTGSALITGSLVVTGSTYLSGLLEVGGNIVPKTAQGATLGTVDRPFSEIFVSSGSINIASDSPGDPNTTISNVQGNLQISAGGMRLLGSASFIAETGSFQYISGSMTQEGDYNQIGNKVITGSLIVTAGITGSLFGTASFALRSEPIGVSGTSIYTTTPPTSQTSTDHGIFFGTNAGNGASLAHRSIFLSTNAGLNASNAHDSFFAGVGAGNNAENADHAVLIGANAGGQAPNVNGSLFVGEYAGYGATNSNNSTFIGYNAGQYATSASFSTLIGYKAGFNYGYGALGVKSNNIIIGTNITLPHGTKDSINLGGIIFATGSYSTITGDPYTGTSNGKVGVNVVNPQHHLDVSGSIALTDNLVFNNSSLTTGSLGSIEYNGTAFFATPSSTQRSIIQTPQIYHNRTAVSYANNTTQQSLLGLTNGVVVTAGVRYAFTIKVTLFAAADNVNVFFANGGTATYSNTDLYADVGKIGYLGAFAPLTRTYLTLTTDNSIRDPKHISYGLTGGTYWETVIHGNIDVSGSGYLKPIIQFSPTPGANPQCVTGGYMEIYPIGVAGSSNTSIGNWS